jgi:hypothetical protein
LHCGQRPGRVYFFLWSNSKPQSRHI